MSNSLDYTRCMVGVLWEAETAGFWWSPSCPSFLLSVLCFCVLFVFILCLVCLMLPVSLDFHFWLPLRFSLRFI